MNAPTPFTLHQGDLPEGLDLGASVAIDTETMGLHLHRDRLCLVQLSSGDGHAHLVRIIPGRRSPRLTALLADPDVEVLFHYARFDLAVLAKALGAMPQRVYCTKTASKLCRTNTDRHGLRNLCQDLLGVDISKAQQTSDWGASDLNALQLAYAAEDVLHLHKLRTALDALLAREGRMDLATMVMAALPARAALDLAGWADVDIFAH